MIKSEKRKAKNGKWKKKSEKQKVKSEKQKVRSKKWKVKSNSQVKKKVKASNAKSRSTVLATATGFSFVRFFYWSW